MMARHFMWCNLGRHRWTSLPSKARACTRCGRTEMMFYDTWEVVTPREAYGTLNRTASAQYPVSDDAPKAAAPTKLVKTATLRQTN